MKLWLFDTNAERDWVAANDEGEARRVYMQHYGLSERDMDGVDISEADPSEVEVYPEGWDFDDDEAELPNAAEIMAKMTKPGLVASTNQ